ncbi:unnamed protein product [Oikopleura dioica]|uniref:Uncharacterized protein n=1 Tax=Oikopleura dioica TaxID=34765 RepID=E4XU24_OIKDI|nr:unnamed protein product [Oikopleura dioica]
MSESPNEPQQAPTKS